MKRWFRRFDELRYSLTRSLVLAAAIGVLGQAIARPAGGSDDLPALLKAFEQLGPEGKGSAAAQAAWRQLAALDGQRLPELLAALDAVDAQTANWICAAIEAVAERQTQHHGKLPVATLEQFLADRSHAPHGRWLAYELIRGQDAKAADRWLPLMLDDPSLELRRDAVARVLEHASELAKGEAKDDAKRVFQQALDSARDLDQIQAASQQLKQLGVAVDLPRQFGFLTRWKVVGPFDNHQGKGFSVEYPPEQGVDLAARYEAKTGAVGWSDAQTGDDFGTLDLNKALGTAKGVVAFAVAEFQSDRRQPIQVRLGSPNAHKVWLNGRLISQAEIYHSYSSMDQYLGEGVLEPGANTILIKLCQNEQTEEWAVDWKVQLRVCDSNGGAILSSDRR